VRVTVLHQGVPIGVGDLTVDDDAFFADLEALPAYAAIQPAMRDAFRAVANWGFLPPRGAAVGGVTPAGDAAGRAALRGQHTVEAALELRDFRGGVLPTHHVSLRDGGTGFTLMGWIDEAPAPTPAVRPVPPLAGDGHVPPAA
jgi:hypothetical protein